MPRVVGRTKAHPLRGFRTGIARASADWRSVIEDCSLDAVAVATPPAIQPEIVLSALKQAKAVFAEKPMALNLAKVDEMTHCAAESRRPNVVDFNFTSLVVCSVET